ncbi:MAG TPA: maleylpyruvate isomerase family mycothiol-dependent enzyme [Acidimicrobiia bacterium]|nr:maleylpyruvate isomerase family mycothiol-dependent enzyme [Acidimicrobiia bacterium]
MTTRPDDDLRRVRSAHARLLETVGGLDDQVARRPSLLPGWDVAMLVTHLARNADGHAGVAEGARGGERRRRYPSPEARDTGIEAGRRRPAAEVADDLRASIERLEQAWGTLPLDAWVGVGLSPTDEPEPIAEAPAARLREVEIHHADLGLGFTFEDWEATFVAEELDRWMPGLGVRLPPGVGASVVATDTGRTWTIPTADRDGGGAVDVLRVEAPSRALLAWLVGRRTGGLPELGPWGW